MRSTAFQPLQSEREKRLFQRWFALARMLGTTPWRAIRSTIALLS
jgi:hypothetical protein